MDATVEQPPRNGPGPVLAAERERQGLGPADVAQRIHMSVWQVEALEAGDYSRLPRGPFLKGFVRNYAKAVGLAPESIVGLLADAAPREQAPRIVVPSQNIHFEGGRIPPHYVRATAVAGVLLVFGFAAMYWWLFIRNAPPMSSKKPAAESVAAAPATTPAPIPVTTPPAAPPPVVAEAPKIEPAKIEPAKIEPAKVEPAKVEPPPRNEPPKAAARIEPPKAEPAKVERVAATASGSTLKFRFAGKSWVEIKDGSGKVLMTGLNDSGSEAEVVGKPPLRVTVGNAPEVRMFVNDREFDLAPHMREAVARFTVE